MASRPTFPNCPAGALAKAARLQYLEAVGLSRYGLTPVAFGGSYPPEPVLALSTPPSVVFTPPPPFEPLPPSSSARLHGTIR